MKKFVAFLILICALMGVTAFADAGSEGHIYSTDILAFVNGNPINGYNIGGKTVIIAEDLIGYGFDVEYDDTARTLSVKSYFNRGYGEKPEISRGKVGEIIGNIYKTDIKCYYNGILIDGYNIGGRTAICIEELGELTDNPNGDYGYSHHLGRAIWDGENRIISYESYIDNKSDILGISRVYHRFKDNVIYTYPDDFFMQSEFSPVENGVIVGTYTYSPGAGMSRYILKPLYFDNKGELVKIGTCVVNPNNSSETLMYIDDTQKVRELIKGYKTPRKTHDEAVEYIYSICTDEEMIENDDYTVIKANHETKGIIFAYINKKGGFLIDTFFADYSDRDIKFWFDTEDVNSGPNAVAHSVYPFGGPHGTTTMTYVTELDTLDFEQDME